MVSHWGTYLPMDVGFVSYKAVISLDVKISSFMGDYDLLLHFNLFSYLQLYAVELLVISLD